ncbi:hypothetical protein Ciccas_014464, partial [Cichlidogyrus casuarinus]
IVTDGGTNFIKALLEFGEQDSDEDDIDLDENSENRPYIADLLETEQASDLFTCLHLQFKKRFESTSNNRDLIISALIHPKFKASGLISSPALTERVDGAKVYISMLLTRKSPQIRPEPTDLESSFFEDPILDRQVGVSFVPEQPVRTSRDCDILRRCTKETVLTVQRHSGLKCSSRAHIFQGQDLFVR